LNDGETGLLPIVYEWLLARTCEDAAVRAKRSGALVEAGNRRRASSNQNSPRMHARNRGYINDGHEQHMRRLAEWGRRRKGCAPHREYSGEAGELEDGRGCRERKKGARQNPW
jgi:hypothetical protein